MPNEPAVSEGCPGALCLAPECRQEVCTFRRQHQGVDDAALHVACLSVQCGSCGAAAASAGDVRQRVCVFCAAPLTVTTPDWGAGHSLALAFASGATDVAVRFGDDVDGMPGAPGGFGAEIDAPGQWPGCSRAADRVERKKTLDRAGPSPVFSSLPANSDAPRRTRPALSPRPSGPGRFAGFESRPPGVEAPRCVGRIRTSLAVHKRLARRQALRGRMGTGHLIGKRRGRIAAPPRVGANPTAGHTPVRIRRDSSHGAPDGARIGGSTGAVAARRTVDGGRDLRGVTGVADRPEILLIIALMFCLRHFPVETH